MAIKEKVSKNEKLLQTLPYHWETYKHIFITRETKINNGVNFLLIVLTFLPIIGITLYSKSNNWLYIFPIIVQFFALLLLLKSFYMVRPKIPWMELETTLNQLEKGTFVSDLIATLKAAENSTYTYLTAMNKILKRSIDVLVFSIFALALIPIVNTFGNSLLYVLVLSLVAVFAILYEYYNQQLTYNFDKDFRECTKQLEKWINKNEKA